MKEKRKDVLVKELRKNIDILDGTFEKYGLEVLSVGISGVDEDGNFMVIVEVLKKDQEKLKDIEVIKANCYDEEGIICTGLANVFADNFSGYDTFEIHFFDEDNLIYRANKIRVFMP